MTTSLGLTVVSIERNGNDPLPLLQNRKAPVIPKAHKTLNADDVLLLFGAKGHVKEFANYYQR